MFGRLRSSLQKAVGTEALGELQPQGSQDALLLGVGAGDATHGQLLTCGGLHEDVSDTKLAQFAEDYFGAHRAWLGDSVTAAWIGLVDQGFQVGTFGEMVERFPQGVGQDADEDVRLGAATVMVPDGAQQEVALEDAEGMFDDGELHVRFPELLGGPTGLVAAQQVGAVSGESVPELGNVPDIAQ